MISMCKIHIYIDSDSFRHKTNSLKNVGVCFLVTLGQNRNLRYGHFSDLLEYFWG